MTSILYIHGLNSSPASRKAQQLLAAMQRIGLQAQLRMPALHHHPRQAIAQLDELIAELGQPVLVGSSLGGYYATHLAARHGLKALLINPAVLPHERFDGYLGEQTNHYSGETWQLTHDHVEALAELGMTFPAEPDAQQAEEAWQALLDELGERPPCLFVSVPPAESASVLAVMTLLAALPPE